MIPEPADAVTPEDEPRRDDAGPAPGPVAAPAERRPLPPLPERRDDGSDEPDAGERQPQQ